MSKTRYALRYSPSPLFVTPNRTAGDCVPLPHVAQGHHGVPSITSKSHRLEEATIIVLMWWSNLLVYTRLELRGRRQFEDGQDFDLRRVRLATVHNAAGHRSFVSSSELGRVLACRANCAGRGTRSPSLVKSGPFPSRGLSSRVVFSEIEQHSPVFVRLATAARLDRTVRASIKAAKHDEAASYAAC